MPTKPLTLVAPSRGRWLGILLSVLLAAACSPPAAPGARQSPAGGASAPSPAARAGAAASGAEWEQQWDQLVAGAKAEGKVVVYGPPTPETRDRLTAAFEKRFGIALEYLAVGGGDAAARVISEHGAGVYAADAMLAGPDSAFRTLAASGHVENDVMGVFAPLRPVLILPEVTDPTKYRNGKLWFVDPAERYLLRIANFVYTPIFVNTSQIGAGELKGWNDLLKPEYRGKIAGADPTATGGGPGLPTASFLYVTQGEEFLRDFYFGQ